MKHVSCSVLVKGLYVKSWKINNNQKRTFNIDNDALTDQVFTLLDAAQSDNKHEINELMNDF